MARRLIYAANWKMNNGPGTARSFAERFLELTRPVDGRELWFFPPIVSVTVLADAFRARSDISVGAQNAHWESKGAYTGEVSLPMAIEAGARVILIGHSERRHLFGETDDQVARKAVAALKAGLTPLVCVGETLAERDGGRTEQVVLRQIVAVLDRVAADDWQRIVLAYEPVWAIGTGKTATPEIAADAHRTIRAAVREKFGKEAADAIRILYGGSVKPDNTKSLMAQPEIDGVLVGGASLDPVSFASIVNF